MAEKEAAFCPNCAKPAVRQGKVILCENCDASFRFTQEGPKISEIGPIESRLRTVEEKLGIGTDVKVIAAADAPAPEPDNQGGDEDNPQETDADEDGI